VPEQAGVDFYQYWGVAKCQRATNFTLGSPYRNGAGYGAQLRQLAAASGDATLQRAVASRDAPDLTGTPFVYYLMGSLPGPYSRTLLLYRAALFAAFALAVFLLARPLASPAMAGALAASTAVASDALLLDLAVGNLSSLQLLGLVGAAVVARRDPRLRTALWLPPLLVLLTLVKPVVGLAAGLLGLSLLLRQVSWQARAVVVGSAAAAAGLFAALPALLFGSVTVWPDWWSATFSSGERLAYEVVQGNYSGVALLARLGGHSTGWGLAWVAASLGGSVLALAALVRWRHGAGSGFGAATLEFLRDPLAAASLGIVALLALSPLVWSHYGVLAVAPALWLCGPGGGPWPRALGWLSLLLVVDLPRRLYLLLPDLPWMVLDLNHAFAWIPLWIGMLGVLAAKLPAPPLNPPLPPRPS